MHEKDTKKIMAAGFVLYRCSEVELVVKRRSAAQPHWMIVSRVGTKTAIRTISRRLHDDPNVIQV